MTRVEQIEQAIDSLPTDEYRQFRAWFLERECTEWEKQIEADSNSGKLDFLIDEANNEKVQGKLRQL